MGEIVPMKVKWTDPKSGEEKEVTVSADDGVREVTEESLGKIKPAFAKNGSIHAGNASQISDGAAAVLLMKRSHRNVCGVRTSWASRWRRLIPKVALSPSVTHWVVRARDRSARFCMS